VHSALASPSRRRLLELLQASDTPLDVHDVAALVGLHPSTVRSHLEVMRTVGLVVRHTRAPSGTGRPRTAYAFSPRGRAETPAAYQRLAGVLAAHLSDTSEERAARGEQAGFVWAEQLVPDSRQDEVPMSQAARLVTGVFDEMGFEPELSATSRGWQIALHACPFRAVAREHPEVVCSVHLGLLRGSLARLGAKAATSLRPFVEPELCLAQLGPLSDVT